MPIARSKGVVNRIRRTQREYGLTAKQMAAELHITAEWLSNLLNGHHAPSYNISLRFEDFVRRKQATQAAPVKGPTRRKSTFSAVALKTISEGESIEFQVDKLGRITSSKLRFDGNSLLGPSRRNRADPL